MEIRMKTIMVGPNVSRHPGERCVVSAEEGELLVKGGYAEAVEKPAEHRTTAASAGTAPVSPETVNAAEEAPAAGTAGGVEPESGTEPGLVDGSRKKGGKH